MCRVRVQACGPTMDLVLDALCFHPFEPLEGVGLFLSLKTAGLQVLSTHPSCLRFDSGYTKVSLRPNLAFVLLVLLTTGVTQWSCW